MIKFILLTHERELSKPSNTGKLVKHALGDQVDTIIWKRKEPNAWLLSLFETKQAVLLFPDTFISDMSESAFTREFSQYSVCVIIDSTWQEARKIYNHSDYLKTADKLSINSSTISSYALRRNQIEGGLSTAECAIEILSECREYEKVELLKTLFDEFNQN